MRLRPPPIDFGCCFASPIASTTKGLRQGYGRRSLAEAAHPESDRTKCRPAVAREQTN